MMTAGRLTQLRHTVFRNQTITLSQESNILRIWGFYDWGGWLAIETRNDPNEADEADAFRTYPGSQTRRSNRHDNFTLT